MRYNYTKVWSKDATRAGAPFPQKFRAANWPRVRRCHRNPRRTARLLPKEF